MEFEAEEEIQNMQLMNGPQGLPPAAPPGPLKLDPPGPPAPEVCQQPGKAANSKSSNLGTQNQSPVRGGIALASTSFPPGNGI